MKIYQKNSKIRKLDTEKNVSKKAKTASSSKPKPLAEKKSIPAEHSKKLKDSKGYKSSVSVTHSLLCQ